MNFTLCGRWDSRKCRVTGAGEFAQGISYYQFLVTPGGALSGGDATAGACCERL